MRSMPEFFFLIPARSCRKGATYFWSACFRNMAWAFAKLACAATLSGFRRRASWNWASASFGRPFCRRREPRLLWASEWFGSSSKVFWN